MQLVLEDQETLCTGREQPEKDTSKELFDASSAWQPLGTDVSHGANVLIQGRRIRAVAFSHLQPRLLSTWHQPLDNAEDRSEEPTSELQSLMRISYSCLCCIKK